MAAGYNFTFVIFIVFLYLLKQIESRQQWQFPKYNINQDGKNTNPDDSEKISALWYEQAITGLMAVIGTRLQRELKPTSSISLQLEKCASKANNSVQYAQCLAPLIRQKRLIDQWRKHREYRRKSDQTKRRLRYSRAVYPDKYVLGDTIDIGYHPQNQPSFYPIAQQTTEKPFLVEIADWLTDAVKYAKKNIPAPPRVGIKQQNVNPRNAFHGLKHENFFASKNEYTAKDEVIEDTPVEGFVKRLFAPALFGNNTAPDGWSSKRFSSTGVLSNVTIALDNFLKIHGSPSNDIRHKAFAHEIVPSWQIEFLQDVRQLVTTLTQQAEQQAKQQQDIKANQAAVKLLSPRILPLDADQQQYDASFLSPDILSFTNDGIASIPQMLGATVGEQSKDAWLNMIMEASGVKDYLNGDEKMLNLILKHNNDPKSNLDTFSKVYNQVSDKFEETFQQLYRTFSTDQIDKMEKHSYAYMSRDQIEYIYQSDDSPCAGQPNCNVQYDLDRYEKMTDQDRDEAIMDFILELANAEEEHFESWPNNQENNQYKKRSKRTLFLTPVKFSPVIKNSKAISMPIILSPILFSPIILSPSVLGPVILSPAIFSPIILSPLLLGSLILSPFLGNPVILSPLCLFPIILSPLVLNPFVLSPYCLTPLILTPLVLSPSILDPNVLSPLILDPGVLSPIILSPFALSPIIASPQAVGGLILSPSALSPIIASPVAVFALILSPQLLGG